MRSTRTLATGFSVAEGPSWWNGSLVFTDVGKVPGIPDWTRAHNGKLWRWSQGSGLALVQEGTGGAVGTTVDNEGRLLCCEALRRRVMRREHDGATTLVADAWNGVPLSNPNDIVVKSDGSIYFTDSGTKRQDRPFHGVFRVSADLATVDLVARDFELVNGLAFSPDERVLYVNDSHGVLRSIDFYSGVGTIRAYDVCADGTLRNSRLFCELRGVERNVPDGMKVDDQGTVYCTGPGGVWVIDPHGSHIDTIGVDEGHASNMAFGGEDGELLFITTSTALVVADR
jgi:gluconolactonase